MKFSELQRLQRMEGITVLSADERIEQLEARLRTITKERDALRAKIKQMEKQEPVGTLPGAKGWDPAMQDAFGPLPKKPAAAFHHPIGFELYDALAMDLHAMKYAEQCVKAEREACAITTSSLKISPQCLAVTANRAVVCPILSGHIAALKPA